MKRLWKVGLLVLMLVTASYAKDVSLKEEVFENYVLKLTQPRHITVDPNKHIWLIFTDKDGNTFAMDKNEKTTVTVNQGHSGESSGTVFFFQRDKIHFLWREKTEGKELLFRSVDLKTKGLENPILIDKESEPLARLKIGGTKDGTILLVWYGEKGDKKGKRYSIYSSFSKDFGKTFSKTVDLTPQTRSSLYPSLVVDEKGNGYVFTEVVNEEGHTLVVRKYSDGKWEEPVAIGKVGTVSIYLRPIIVGERILVFWFNFYEGIPLTEMAYSDDGGKTWQRKAFESTRGLDLNGLQVVTGGDGQSLYVALSGVTKTPEGEKKGKDKVYILYSHDKGTTFSDLTPLRHYPYEHTMAHLPNIVAKGKEVVVVWNDYRNIRANLYMNYSKDGGITWQEQDIPLEEPGKFNTVLHWEANNLISLDDKYYVLAHRFKNDAMEEPVPVVIEFKIQK